MLFQLDRYLLKKQIKENSRYVRGIVLDAGSGGVERYKKFLQCEKYIKLDINVSAKPDILGSVESMPMDNESVDSVIATQVLEHVKNPQKAVEEFYRVLKIGGYCLLTAPQYSELHEEPNDYFRFTKFGLEELFKKAGFKIIKIDRRGGFWGVNSQISVRYVIDLLNLNKHSLTQKIFNPLFWVCGMAAIGLDLIDKSRANLKHAIGWLIIARK